VTQEGGKAGTAPRMLNLRKLNGRRLQVPCPDRTDNKACPCCYRQDQPHATEKVDVRRDGLGAGGAYRRRTPAGTFCTRNF